MEVGADAGAGMALSPSLLGGHDPNASGPRIEESKLYVSGLSSSTSKERLKEAFEPYGAYECEVITDKQTGRSRGFGYAYFDSKENARIALQAAIVVDGRVAELSECWEKGASSGPYRGAQGAHRASPY